MEGRELNNPKATIHECGVREDAVLLLRRKVIVAGRSASCIMSEVVICPTKRTNANRTAEQDAEMMRLQILGDPRLMDEIRNASSALCYILSRLTIRFLDTT